MSKFGIYNIVLKDIAEGTKVFEYTLDDVFFSKIDSPEVQKGNLVAIVNVSKKELSYELSFDISGFVIVPCDRCLDDLELNIQHKEKLEVQLGESYDEIGEVVIVPQVEGAINVAWFMYEFIVLNIPIKHVHPSGECNKTVMSKLKSHIARQKDDTEEENIYDYDEDDESEDINQNDVIPDARWEKLQDFNENN